MGNEKADELAKLAKLVTKSTIDSNNISFKHHYKADWVSIVGTSVEIRNAAKAIRIRRL